MESCIFWVECVGGGKLLWGPQDDLLLLVYGGLRNELWVKRVPWFNCTAVVVVVGQHNHVAMHHTEMILKGVGEVTLSFSTAAVILAHMTLLPSAQEERGRIAQGHLTTLSPVN